MCYHVKTWDKHKYTFILMMSQFTNMTLVVIRLRELFLTPQLQTEILDRLIVSSQK